MEERGRGRIIENPTFRIPYAANTPNANDASDAQRSITTSSKFAIHPALVNCCIRTRRRIHYPLATSSNDAILAENTVALTLISIYQ